MAVAGLALIGTCLQAVVQPMWDERRAVHGTPDSKTLQLTSRGGLSFGVLGGFRTIAADLVWLKSYVAWEQRDARTTESMLQLTTALDPRPLNFWINGARMIAYDFAAWHIAEVECARVVSESERETISQSHAQRAVLFLERAAEFHPSVAALWIERANIELNCARDVSAAAESYRRASQLDDAPFFAARIHAELLRRLDRKQEALAWLIALHPALPCEVAAAAADLVFARIRELESELAVPPTDRFVPRARNGGAELDL
jgi:hypothetical protein